MRLFFLLSVACFLVAQNLATAQGTGSAAAAAAALSPLPVPVSSIPSATSAGTTTGTVVTTGTGAAGGGIAGVQSFFSNLFANIGNFFRRRPAPGTVAGVPVSSAVTVAAPTLAQLEPQIVADAVQLQGQVVNDLTQSIIVNSEDQLAAATQNQQYAPQPAYIQSSITQQSPAPFTSYVTVTAFRTSTSFVQLERVTSITSTTTQFSSLTVTRTLSLTERFTEFRTYTITPICPSLPGGPLGLAGREPIDAETLLAAILQPSNLLAVENTVAPVVPYAVQRSLELEADAGSNKRRSSSA